MSAPCPSVCTPWATMDDVTRLRGDTAAATPRLGEFLLPASDLLYEASRRLYAGSCEDTVRPCARRTDGSPSWHGRVVTGLDGWGWQTSWGGCSCNEPLSRRCDCTGLSQLALGGDPVTSIVEVLIDGMVVAPSSYTVHDNHWLVGMRDDSGALLRFPCCQALSRPSTEEGTWQVTFTYGIPPPPNGVLAAVDVALELAKDSAGGDCALPPRITSMIRQGVQVALIDPMTIVASGGFGVYSADLFCQPYVRKGRPATVHVPSRRNRVVRDTGTS